MNLKQVLKILLLPGGSGGDPKIYIPQSFTSLLKNAGALKVYTFGSTTFGGVIGTAAAPADLDVYQAFLYLNGTETKINIASYKNTDCGKYELWINEVQDSASLYDEYVAAALWATRTITLTGGSFKKGYNLVELRVNGKNAASTNYFLNISLVTAS